MYALKRHYNILTGKQSQSTVYISEKGGKGWPRIGYVGDEHMLGSIGCFGALKGISDAKLRVIIPKRVKPKDIKEWIDFLNRVLKLNIKLERKLVYCDRTEKGYSQLDDIYGDYRSSLSELNKRVEKWVRERKKDKQNLDRRYFYTAVFSGKYGELLLKNTLVRYLWNSEVFYKKLRKLQKELGEYDGFLVAHIQDTYLSYGQAVPNYLSKYVPQEEYVKLVKTKLREHSSSYYPIYEAVSGKRVASDEDVRQRSKIEKLVLAGKAKEALAVLKGEKIEE